jgi:hypothetical protein
MFVPIKASEFWGTTDGSPPDAWFYSMGWVNTTRPYYCETNKKWLLVWKPIPHEEAIQASRDYYYHLPRLLNYHTAVRMDIHTGGRVMSYRGKRPPIQLWEYMVIDPIILEKIVERADPYHESNFSLWEKYPDKVPDVYHAIAGGKRIHPRFSSPTSIGFRPHVNEATQSLSAMWSMKTLDTLKERVIKLQQSSAFGQMGSGNDASKKMIIKHPGNQGKSMSTEVLGDLYNASLLDLLKDLPLLCSRYTAPGTPIFVSESGATDVALLKVLERARESSPLIPFLTRSE